MHKLYILIGFIIFVNKTQAQQTDTESQNYKHLHTPSQEHSPANNQEMVTEEVGLNNQKTQKKSSRTYIIGPTAPASERNVQGKKTKKNYKNQFN